MILVLATTRLLSIVECNNGFLVVQTLWVNKG